jgi:hypothetical protein
MPIAALALGDRLELGPADRPFVACPEIEDLLHPQARAGEAPAERQGVARQAALTVAGSTVLPRQSHD